MRFSQFQTACIEALGKGESVLLIAPTGTGKTIAATEPFVLAAREHGGLLGARLMYSLPVRALAGGVQKDLDGRLQAHQRHFKSIIHYGGRPESNTFTERAVITTLDQVMTAFAGTPLSFSAQSGHSAAGAALLSYSVFDEAHLLDPKAGLPLLFAMLAQRRSFGLISCVMTATLPKKVINHLAQHLKLTVIQASDEDASYRDDRRKVTIRHAADTAPNTTERVASILQAWKDHGRVIVFCNTVPSAVQMYDALRENVDDEDIVLAHSRFAPTDRERCDDAVKSRFEEDGKGGILVCTQVAEVGLNISAPACFSESAPADALIQRAGRCARFFRNATPDSPIHGEFTVWPLYASNGSHSEKDRTELCLPYDSGVVQATQDALQILGLNGLELTWEQEQKFVNASLEDYYSAFIGKKDLSQAERIERRKNKGATTMGRPSIPLTPIAALGAFERAFHAHDVNEVEALLRDSVTVNVAVVEDFEAARAAYNNPGPGKKRCHPETVSLRLRTFAALYKANEWQIREVHINSRVKRTNDRLEREPMQLMPVQKLVPNHTYFILASEAGYSPQIGLVRKGKHPGTPTPMRRLPLYEKGQDRQDGERQTWVEHALGAHREAKRILTHYRPFLVAWATKAFPNNGMQPDDITDALQQMLELAVLLHDVGKLNDVWQERVGRNPEEAPLARTTEVERAIQKAKGIPPPPFHAQHIFPLLKSLLDAETNKDSAQGEERTEYLLHSHIALAAARHHVLTLDGDLNQNEEDRFQWTAGGKEAVKEAVRQAFGEEAPTTLDDEFLECLTQQHTAGEAPGPASNEYFLYCLANRLVKFSDICNAGAGNLELFVAEEMRQKEGNR